MGGGGGTIVVWGEMRDYSGMGGGDYSGMGGGGGGRGTIVG